LWPSRHSILLFFLPDSQSDFGDVIAHALLVHDFLINYIWGINPSYWSIAVEFQLIFYTYP
jgi:hypothetical protein